MRHPGTTVTAVRVAILCHIAAVASPGACNSRGPVSLFVASCSFVPSEQLTAEDGSILRPFRTLARARDEVRALRQGACGLPVGGVTINLRGGVYELSEPLRLSAVDSGTARSPITWRAYGSEPVLISGGVEIPRGAFSAVAARPYLQVNLTDVLGLTNFGVITAGGADGPPVDTDLAELFFAGQPMHLARWPNQYPNGSTQWAYTGPGKPSGCTTACTSFELRANASIGPLPPSKTRLQAWQQEARERAPYLHGYWQYDWRDTYIPLGGTSITSTGGRLKVADPSLLAKAKLGARFYALNLLSELDAEGEFYLERTNRSAVARAASGMLYFYPPSGDWTDLEKKVYLSMTSSLVVLEEGARYIRFVGLRFEHSRETAIASGGSSHVKHITIQNCTVANTGGGGDSHRGGAIDLTGTANLIDSCVVYGTAGTGVSLRGGYHINLTRGDNVMRDCNVHSTSRWFRTYRPGIAWAGVGNTFQVRSFPIAVGYMQ